MPLADDIRALRDRTLADLAAAHDYFTESKAAWRLVARDVSSGRGLTVHSKVTGTVASGRQLVSKSRNYVRAQLTQATFQQFLTIFEAFVADLLALWLAAYPRSLAAKPLDFGAVLDAPDRDAVIAGVVREEVARVLYGKPADWFAYLDRVANLGVPTADQVEQLAEAKAARDVLVHNRGVVNKTYLAKAGRRARYRGGEKLDLPDPYHRQTWELLQVVVAAVADAAAAKAA